MLWIQLIPLKEVREGFLEAETTKAGNVLGHVLFRKIYSGLSF